MNNHGPSIFIVCILFPIRPFSPVTKDLSTSSTTTPTSQALTVRNLLAAVEAWGERFIGSEEVTFLSANRDVTLAVNDSRADGGMNGLQKTLKGLEEKYEYRTNFQLGDNFFCNDVSVTERSWVTLVAKASSTCPFFDS